MKTNTLILHTAALAIMPLQLMFSVFLLLRGHDEPGGGFIGGYLKLSTVLIFDIGVYLAVLGTLMTFVISLMESEE